jgi:hypothetical protein
MNKLLIRLAIFILLCFFNLKSENAHNIKHGTEIFKRLSMTFPRHFAITNNENKLVSINEEDTVGRYLISIFSEKTRSGWINWADRKPLGANYAGQCIFYEALDLKPPQQGIEIMLSERFKDENSSHEEFWATLIFEICNAMQAEEYVKLIKSFKNKSIDQENFSESMLKTEYLSAINAQKFQREIWIPFSEKNQLQIRRKNWFFTDDTTFEQWKLTLSTTKEGSEYLDAYGSVERPPQKLDR